LTLDGTAKKCLVSLVIAAWCTQHWYTSFFLDRLFCIGSRPKTCTIGCYQSDYVL
jgi:hypothetical protein